MAPCKGRPHSANLAPARQVLWLLAHSTREPPRGSHYPSPVRLDCATTTAAFPARPLRRLRYVQPRTPRCLWQTQGPLPLEQAVMLRPTCRTRGEDCQGNHQFVCRPYPTETAKSCSRRHYWVQVPMVRQPHLALFRATALSFVARRMGQMGQETT